MSSALQAADPGFSLSGFGKAFSTAAPPHLNNLSDYLASHPIATNGFAVNGAHHLNPLTGTPTYTTAEIKKVSQNFESIFMRMMFKEMRDSVQKSNLFGDSKPMELFQSMYDDQLSDTLSDAGGIGLGKLVYQQLEKATNPHLNNIP